ncbi:serine hydrolase [Cellvibrio zantedeschiae]|uniref:Serine hydrolase n=1 Tax=Cellvibrio zantedeschiae TaxID=1237077 RepID=A0ABQ3B609_9GAMM|nr:serine hydrolase domain-containing protein [Cellvibrio zantedeschiae]GGY79777.1 serine hydrolase [Cellvibrio zantedeschiae]
MNLSSFISFVVSIFISVLLLGCNTGANKKPDDTKNPPSLTEQVSKLQQQKNIPAVSFAVLENGQPQFALAGTLAVSSAQKIVTSDLLPLGSNSKAFTASLIARFVEQGKLHWNDKVSQWLPLHASYKDLTLEQLLRHESGLSPLTEMKDVADAINAIGGLTGDLTKDQDALINWVLATPSRFMPGGKTEYGNTNYVIAGRIAEHVGKDSYENLVRREIFIPLGINGQFNAPKNGVLGHSWENNQWKVKNITPEEEYINSQLALAAGGWYMSMPDYTQFLKANIDGLRGQSTWLKEPTLKYMHSTTRADQLGIGWQVLNSNGETFSQHLGSDEESYLHGVIFSQKSGKAVAFFTSGYSDAAVNAVSDLALQWEK